MSNVHVNPNFVPGAAAAATGRTTPKRTPSSVHVNPNFRKSVAVPAATPSVHVNPNFRPAPSTSVSSSSSTPHINPNFNRPLPPVPNATAAATLNNAINDDAYYSSSSNRTKTHFNPAFMGSPSKNKPAAVIDPAKQKAYDDVVVKKASAAAQKVLINPKFATGGGKMTFIDPSRKKVAAAGTSGKSSPGSSSSEKENSPATARISTPPSVNRKTVFKKIGQRKLVRVKQKKISARTEVVQSAKSTPFRKIGTRKLIRLQSREPPAPPKQRKSPTHLVYKVKTNRKIVKSPGGPGVAATPLRTPTARRFIISKLVTPLSLRRKRRSTAASPRLNRSHNGQLLQRLNPFKIDRRPKKSKPEEESVAESPEKPGLLAPPQTPKSIPPPKPARKRVSAAPSDQPKPSQEAVVNIDGVKFKVSENGRKLNRLDASSRSAPVRCSVSRKLYVEGEEYVEDEEEPGVLVRSRNSMTRASITNARNRSINTILKSQTRSKQYCMFFNKFGKCNKKEKGVCPYIHDPEKVAVCRKFLAGNCFNQNCLLSHKVAPEKMPSCKFFLNGLCTKGSDCPYRHVKVSDEAAVCPDFLKGYCPAAADCKKKHVNVCPAFESKAVCPKGEQCPLPHASKTPSVPKSSNVPSSDVPSDRKRKQNTSVKKTRAPEKPKRKSLGDAATKKKPRTSRYYEGSEESASRAEAASNNTSTEQLVRDIVLENTSAVAAAPRSEDATLLEAKRKRLMRKVELVKQGWTGVAAVRDADLDDKNQAIDGDSDDSGPYEEIDEDDGDDVGGGDYLKSRPPVGELPSFIPLGKDSDEDEVNEPGDGKEDSFEERLI